MKHVSDFYSRNFDQKQDEQDGNLNLFTESTFDFVPNICTVGGGA